LLFNLLMGSLNWINSQGDKEKIAKAQKQITNAFIGLVLLIIVMALYFTIIVDIFGIFERDPVTNEIKFVLPSLFGP
jgi:Fe2+ transport system protein B